MVFVAMRCAAEPVGAKWLTAMLLQRGISHLAVRQFMV
jgi:hypothetical protein